MSCVYMQVGKWHLGHSKRSMLPLRRGFDSFFGLHGGGFDHYTKVRTDDNSGGRGGGDTLLIPEPLGCAV
jgi:arylsulfatase A-like enzyme